ncbi:ZIP family metal transporter [Mycoplasma sp. 744]|uniref:ZIP family metal transporter n=1 Tax=Mycoplasma sp. 744 TaxID=3108531 RepID=UPI002B1D4665|nr:ZIP family metal transporter [Mycoplasma sp. 744]MEA4115343.1 ZIP family metal transporter [Mycoplasma sp. 744]
MNNFIELLKNAHGNLLDWDADKEILLAKFYLVLISALIILGLPTIIIFILPIFKKNQLSKKTTVLLYAFSTGFFICLALFGFLREAIEISSSKILEQTTWQIYGWNILLVGIGLIIGLLIAFGLRELVRKISSSRLIKNNSQAQLFIHSHDLEHDNDVHTHTIHDYAPDHHIDLKNKSKKTTSAPKFLALLLLLTHRIPAGLLIGYSLTNFIDNSTKQFGALNIAFIISFILHIIPEILIFYYRQLEMGIKKWRAAWITLASILIFIPLMLIGIYFGSFINSSPKIIALMQAIVAGIFLFTAIVEFVPEFYHSHHDKKIFKIVIFVFLLGIVLCAIILSFHTHGT